MVDACTGFQWDQGNRFKSVVKHRVSEGEAEQVFLNEPLVVSDSKHSASETRLYALGCSDDRRMLFVVFTVRTNLIRVISARDMNKKERSIYEACKKDTHF